MNQYKNPWIYKMQSTISLTKRILTKLSINIRNRQYCFFIKIISPNKNDKVLDVGVSADETLSDSNIFERIYPFPDNLTAATIEDSSIVKKRYPKINVVKIKPHKKLPFNDNQFDIAVSWATLEHVGNEKQQKYFLNELARVGKKVFLTTPYRHCPYEPHSEVFFIHWLPRKWFSKILTIIGKKIWANEINLRPLGIRDLVRILPNDNFRFKVYWTWCIFPTHLIIYRI